MMILEKLSGLLEKKRLQSLTYKTQIKQAFGLVIKKQN